MTDVPANGHALLDFNAPLSDARSYDLISGLRALAGKDVVDYGCGWAELLLRIAAHEPGVRAVGVDDDEYAIGRGRAAVAERGLTNVTLHQADATTWPGRADVAISIGASHAWGGTQATLTALRERVTPGGLLLLGDGFWEHPPTPAATAVFAQDEFADLAGLVDLALAGGYRLLGLTTATLDEWDAFESRWCASREHWLLDHPDHPEHAAVQAIVDDHRDGWLKGYRTHLGFAYLTLARR
ncbi:SAM-dependent methyltransferase [Saccharothrix violaceirubra]|uniref:SAM-dependent methyltransferase n=1 Tax=Saccharothrix violaceirubra TaxID=413306 RepID=A0A7W7T0Y7_9PSEU|nr:class I SAM-dependent methyltransferase [Saccharothrix violaceirubra]MBB4964568.1 SAM-dependent methyltransferase [Saccharothrix violaceirubra]